MSVGWRSGVHWMRDTVAPSIEPASARASTVFAVPGTSSSRTCPLQASAARTSRICSSLPSTTVATLATRRADGRGGALEGRVQRGFHAIHPIWTDESR